MDPTVLAGGQRGGGRESSRGQALGFGDYAGIHELHSGSLSPIIVWVSVLQIRGCTDFFFSFFLTRF